MARIVGKNRMSDSSGIITLSLRKKNNTVEKAKKLLNNDQHKRFCHTLPKGLKKRSIFGLQSGWFGAGWSPKKRETFGRIFSLCFCVRLAIMQKKRPNNSLARAKHAKHAVFVSPNYFPRHFFTSYPQLFGLSLDTATD